MVEPSLMEAGGKRIPIRACLSLVRPRQWTKNGFVLAGVLFSGQAFEVSALVPALATFAAFCALSGAVYAANDVRDVKEDRSHPLKRLRPVASGEVSTRSALALALALALGGLAVCFAVDLLVGVAGLAYLVLQALYTEWLKSMAILDVMSISGGFVIRALAGVAAVGSPVSPWLIVCTGLLTLFLGFSKRHHEMAALAEEAVSHRKNLGDYSMEMLDQMMNITVAATIIAYSLYTFTVYEGFLMMVSIPFVIHGMLRYVLLVHHDGGDNPDVLLLRDRALQVTLGLWLVVVAAVIYIA